MEIERTSQGLRPARVGPWKGLLTVSQSRAIMARRDLIAQALLERPIGTGAGSTLSSIRH
jgi:hypothetical protein